MINTNTKEDSTNYGQNLHADAGSLSSSRIRTFVTRRSPRRMYLCDVPLFFEHECSNTNSNNDDDDGINFVCLMGTIVEIIQHSPPIPLTGLPTRAPVATNDHASILHNKSMNGTAHRQTIQLVIDDGTGVIEVLSERRGEIEKENTTQSDYRADTFSGNNNMHIPSNANQINFNINLQPSDNEQLSPSATMAMLKTLLSSSSSLLSVGQTVDCIGRLQKIVDGTIDEGCSPDLMAGKLEKSHTDHRRKGLSASSNRILLVASSISLVNNPQAVTLRHLELSSSSRGDDHAQLRSSNFRRNNNHRIPIPQNRILIGGYLERKLNPLYHCIQDGSVQLNMEEAFRYIKHSKDDGGITSKELASLVGAVEPNEVLAVKLAVERLREDCRIYLNQGKWYPM